MADSKLDAGHGELDLYASNFETGSNYRVSRLNS